MSTDAEIQGATTFVIFGVTGHLSRTKLIPALFDLYAKKMLPKDFRVVGFSRRAFTDEEFRAFVQESVSLKNHGHAEEDVQQFLKRAYYCAGTFEDKNAYVRMAETLAVIDAEEVGACSNKLFHLAVPPSLYSVIFQNLADSGLTIPCGREQVAPPETAVKSGWTRVLVEKPFGKDLQTAQDLDRQLGKYFQEEQVFRIDHYLAKETMQNILAFRFSNALFEPLWNNRHVEKVELALSEKEGIAGRGAFYDGVGALRDVGQNHVLQMLAFVAMEDPKELQAERIRRNRAAVFSLLRAGDIARGQYKGYRAEEQVRSDSDTETYFRMTVFIDNERWRGTPFLLEAGKGLLEKKTEIKIFFRESSCLCLPGTHETHQNTLTFRIEPDEGISAVFWAKKPGFEMKLEPQTLSFFYKDSLAEQKLPDAYERVLFDCIRGDQTLFASTEEVDASWQFITPILERWKQIPLMEYTKGTDSKELHANI